MDELHKNIKDRRMSLGLKQQEMADALNCDYSTYGKLENGRTVMDLPRLEKIAKILKTTIYDLIGGKHKVVAESSPMIELNIILRMTIEEFIKAGFHKKLDASLKDYIIKHKKGR